MLRNILLVLIFFCCGIELHAYDMEYVPYRKGSLYGLSDRQGKIIVQPEYEQIQMESPFYYAFKGTQFTVFNKKAHKIGTYSGTYRQVPGPFFIVSTYGKPEVLYNDKGHKMAVAHAAELAVYFYEGIYQINNRDVKGEQSWNVFTTRGKLLPDKPVPIRPVIFKGIAYAIGNQVVDIIDSSGHQKRIRFPDKTAFYAKYGFSPLIDNPRHLYLPIATLEDLLE